MRTQTATLLVEERYQQLVVNSITAYTAAFILALIAVLALIIVTSLRPGRGRPNEHQDRRRRQAVRRLLPLEDIDLDIQQVS